jgi:aromatic ring-opening dioxygenase catalytic subunit (LigB family)
VNHKLKQLTHTQDKEIMKELQEFDKWLEKLIKKNGTTKY